MNEDDLRQVAIHEAGHVLAGYVLDGDRLEYATVNRLEKMSGHVRFSYSKEPDQELIRRRIMTLLAGSIAEQLYSDNGSSLSDRYEHGYAVHLAIKHLCKAQAEVDECIRSLIGQTTELLSQPLCREALPAIVEALLRHGTVYRRRICEIIENPGTRRMYEVPDDRHFLESKPEEEQAQLTIRMPATLHRQFKTLAAMESRSMGDVVVEMIRDYVRRSKPEDFVFEPPRVKQIDDPHNRTEKVEMILDLRRDGLSFGAIANEMNERGILNLKSKPGWSKGAIYRLVMENAKKFGQLKMEEAGQQKTAKPYQPKLKEEMEHLFDFVEDEDEHDHDNQQEEKNDE